MDSPMHDRPQAVDFLNMRALAAAATGDARELARALSAGASPDARSDEAEAPLAMAKAARESDVRFLSGLIAAGVDQERAPSAAHRAVESLVKMNDLDSVQRLLESGVELSAPKAGKSALELAILGGHGECVSALLDAKASLDGVGQAMAGASEEAMLKVASALRSRGGDAQGFAPKRAPNQPFTREEMIVESAFKAALGAKRPELIASLLDASADPHVLMSVLAQATPAEASLIGKALSVRAPALPVADVAAKLRSKTDLDASAKPASPAP